MRRGKQVLRAWIVAALSSITFASCDTEEPSGIALRVDSDGEVGVALLGCDGQSALAIESIIFQNYLGATNSTIDLLKVSGAALSDDGAEVATGIRITGPSAIDVAGQDVTVGRLVVLAEPMVGETFRPEDLWDGMGEFHSGGESASTIDDLRAEAC